MKVKKLLAGFLSAAMVLGTMSFPAFAEVSGGVEYNGTTYASFADARAAVPSDATEITYTIHGRVVLPDGYINDITGLAASAKILNFKAADGDATAELALEGTRANIIGIDLKGAVKTVNYEDLILSRKNGSGIDDLGHANIYFTTAMRGVSDGIVNYKNCTFPNGSCNNFYNKTTYTNCKFHNDSEYGLWIYGGETEVTGATFTGAKGVQAYSEDANADVKTKITNSTFDGITKKPAIISGTKGTVTLENITTNNCVYGLLQTKPKDGRSDLPYAEVTVDGKEPAYVAMVGSSIYTNQAFANKEAEEKGTPALPIVAKVNGQFYSTLAEAVAAAENGDTVKLLADASGNGIKIPSGSNITIDLGGFTYNVDGTTVGSSGTETNGFQLLKDSNIKFKNGTITSDKAKILIQNYSNLTLENVTLDGSKLVGSAPYTLSNNCGNTVLKGNTNIIAKDGGYAFDCYYWPSNGYTEGVTVTLGTDFTGKITGKIEMTNDGTDTANAAKKQSIRISGGTFTTDVSAFLADGYKLTTNEGGTYGVVVETATHVAQIGEAKYTSLADAIASLEGASGAVTIKLLSDANFSFGARAQIGNKNTTSITIDGGNNVLDLLGTNTDWSSLGNAGGKLVFKNVTINKTGGGNGAWNNHAFNITSYVEFDNVTVNNAVTIHGGGKFTQTKFHEAGEYYTLYIPAVDQDVVIENCNFEAPNGGRGIKVIEQYVSEAEKAPVDITVTDSTFKTAKKAAILVTSTEGANIIASGNNITEVAVDPINLVWVDEDLPASYSKVNVTIDGKAVAPYLEGKGIVVAQIGNAYYTSLADAVAAAANGDTVKLLTNASGNGVKIPSGSNITIDLGGYTYNVDGTTVGSTGTETNGFQLLKDSNIKLKNGTITSDKAKILIQNYSNLTLENVTLDGSNLPGTNRYVLSNNNGNTVLTGNTNIIAKEGDVAFDVCRYANYPSVTVTLDEKMTGTINGNIELSDSADSSTVGAVDAENFNLIIKAGTVNGAINDLRSATQKNHADFGKISGGTFTSDVSEYCADGYTTTKNADGTYGVVIAEEETKPEILKNSLYVTYSELGKFDFGSGKVDSIRLSLFAGVDSLNYSEVGFDVTLNGETQTFPVTVVYDSVKTNINGEVKTVNASEFGKGVNHIFGYTINFPATAEFDNASVKWVPYAIRNKEKITGNTFTLNDIFPGKLEVK